MNQPSWWTTITTADLLTLRRRLLAFVRKEFGPALDAEDVVHQAFLKLFQRRGEVDAAGDGLFRYLCTVARHAATDQVRTRQAREQRLPDAARTRAWRRPSGPSPTEHAGQESDFEKAMKIFRALDDVDRLVIWRHVVDGSSLRSICRDLDLEWHQVLSIIERAMRRFRREFK